MTPQEIQDSARRQYNSTSDDFFTDPEFYDYIFEAEKRLAREALVIQNVYTTPSVNGQRELAYPANALFVWRIEYNGQKLEQINFREDDIVTLSNAYSTTTGTPEFYSLWDDTIYLRNIPDTDGLDIKIYTYDMPSLQTSGNAVLATPAIYHGDIVNYCLAKMTAKDGNMKSYQIYANMFELGVQQAKKDQVKKKTRDSMKRVQNADFMISTRFGVN